MACIEDGNKTTPLVDAVRALVLLEDFQVVAFFFLIHFDLLLDILLGGALGISSGTWIALDWSALLLSSNGV